MDQLKKIKQFTLANMSHQKQLKLCKIVLFTLAALIVILNFTSLGIIGSNFMVWQQLQTNTQKTIMNQRYNEFFVSQQLIIAFNVLTLLMTFVLIFSVFKFYTKGNLIIMGVTLLFWLLRWTASIIFLSGDSDLRSQIQTKYNLIYLQGKINPLCQAAQCTGDLLNYVECGKVILYKECYRFQIGYIVATMIFVIAMLIFAYKTNKLDVDIGQSKSKQDLNQTQ